MHVLLLPFAPRFLIYTTVIAGTVLMLGLAIWQPGLIPLLFVPVAVFAGLAVLGTVDLIQTRHAVLRNYPISAHLRFMLEKIRPEMRQYFFEDEKHGLPFSRDKRAVVYQRAKNVLDKRPFGTQYDVYADGYEWMRHSIAPRPHAIAPFRVTIGGPDCASPYSASIFNISAMSFGALSPNAIRALNGGAKKGQFAHDTGEGGFSPYHREMGGDLIWEVGSGYFGCRTPDGQFCPEKFAQAAAADQIRMVELKLSQGAKPGHGGVAACRQGLARDRPDARRADGQGLHLAVAPFRILHPHRAREIHRRDAATVRRKADRLQALHRTPVGVPCNMQGDARHQDLSGFHRHRRQEGGTGAAPLEFVDHLGMPLKDGLTFAHNALIGIGARDRIRIGASGKIASAFDIARAIALGADWCNSARGFMFALGCIQSQSCHTDRCPTGVTTQDRSRQRALVVPDKMQRVANFHASTMQSLIELTATAGLDHPGEFALDHFSRRVSASEVMTFKQLYPPLEPGELLRGTRDLRFAEAWEIASATSFRPLQIPGLNVRRQALSLG